MAGGTPENDNAAGRGRDEKITDGANDRPRNETIGQTGGGVPDDSGQPVDVAPEEEKRIAEKLKDS